MTTETTTLSGIRYAVADGVATITLARPDVSNAFDLATAQSLGTAVDRAGADPDVRVVLLTAEGPRFCAGGDLASMAAAADPGAAVLELAEALDGALVRLTELEKPVVAAVQGAAAGAGVAVALAADLVVAGRSTKVVAAYSGAGLTQDCGLSWLLPRAVGQQRALEFLLTNRPLAADEARAWGLVTTVVEDDEVLPQALALAQKLAGGSAYALGQARRLVRSSYAATRVESGADESRTIAHAVTTDYATAAIAKFLGR